MAEYIERKAALDVANGWREQLIPTYGKNDEYVKCLETVAEHLEDIPTADVRPVVKARWEKNKRGRYCFVCSNCGFGFPTGFVWYNCNRESDEWEFSIMAEDAALDYCPNCGARMGGEENV